MIFLFLLVGLLLLPFFNLKYSVYKDSPGTQDIKIAVTKFDLFRPKLTSVKKLGDNSYYVFVRDYERDGLFYFKDTGFNNGVKSDLDENGIDARIYNKSEDEIIKLAADNDLSKVNPDGENIDGKGVVSDTKSIEKGLVSMPENRYFEELKYYSKNEPSKYPNFLKRDKSLTPFTSLKKSITLNNVIKITGIADLNRGFNKENSTGLPEENYLINSNSINFVALGYDSFGSLKNPNEELDARLQKIVIVKQDRTFIEVPLKSDNSFDFDSIADKLK